MTGISHNTSKWLEHQFWLMSYSKLALVEQKLQDAFYQWRNQMTSREGQHRFEDFRALSSPVITGV